MADAARPPISMAAATATPTRRRLRVVDVTSDLHALGAEPPFHLILDGSQSLSGPRLEPHHDNRLRVRRANQTPAVAEQNSRAVNGDDVIPGREMSYRLFDDAELDVIVTIDANLRRRHEAGYVREKIAHRFAGRGDDVKQAGGSVQSVVEPVKPFREEHVARHLAADRRVRLVHLVFDQRMAGLPHHRNATRFRNGFRQRLRRLDIENDRLTLSSALERITSVDDQQVVAPDNLAGAIDDADAIRVTVEGDPDVGPLLFHGRDQVLEIPGDCRIRVVIRKGPVAFAEEKMRLDSKLSEEFGNDQ